MNRIDEIKSGSIVQFASDWGKDPTPGNTSIVNKVAKDRSWATVTTPYGNKRVPNPDTHLRLVKGSLVVTLDEGLL